MISSLAKVDPSSQIDFVTVSYSACDCIMKIDIDKIGDYRFKSIKKETDQNTILFDICIPDIKRAQNVKQKKMFHPLLAKSSVLQT